MKTRMVAAASIILAVVLIATMSIAAPSCCDPKNSSTQATRFAPVQQTNGPMPVAVPQTRVVTRQIAAGRVRPTPKYSGRPVPRTQYAVAKPVGFPNAPAAPSCCSTPNNRGPARGINASVQGQFRGCACCGGGSRQPRYSGFQPVNGQVQLMSNPPRAGQQVYPAGQASCCSTTGSVNNQGRGWNVAQPTGFPGLW
jgi:hypothetical protein